MSTKKGRDVDGNAMASALAVQRQFIRTGELLARVEHVLDGYFEEDIHVTGIRLKAPEYPGQPWLGVVSAVADGKSVVCFQSGDSFAETLVGVLNRLENKSMKWKEDQWRK